MLTIIAAAGDDALIGKEISVALEDAISGRKPVLAKERSQFVHIISDTDCPFDYTQEIIVPIIPEGDTEGAVVILSKSTDLGEAEIKIAKTAAAFIGNQMRL